MRQWVVVAWVENSPSFVFWKLRRFLHFGQNRVENAVLRAEMFGRNGLSGAARSREIGGCFALARWSVFDDSSQQKTELRFGNFLKTLMCVLASVRNFSVVCFL